jgi:hypothetical protein
VPIITGECEQWRRSAREYCERVDLYSLVDRASDAIIARAERARANSPDN